MKAAAANVVPQPPRPAWGHKQLILCPALLLLALSLAGCGAGSGSKGAAQTSGTATSSTPPPAGDLLIETSPGGANVFLDGVLQGQSPLTIKGLPATSYVVRAEKEGFSAAEVTIAVSAHTLTTLALTLVPLDPADEIRPPF